MKKLFRFFLYFIGFLLLASLLLYAFGYGYVLKGIRTTYLTGHVSAFIDDYPYFDNHKIENSDSIQEWPLSENYNQIHATKTLDSLNDELGTAAFLIIKNDSIWFEKYYDDYGKLSKTNSFSMAKSVTVALMFKAIQEGYLENINQPVADFYPKFDKRLSLGDLASMSSGLDWSENYYNPFGNTAQAYFDKNIRKEILDLKVVEEPGKEFKYLSGNSELLGMVISKATGKSLSQYLSESFWKPMGMNDDALWQIDSEESGMEKTYCCIASNARNFAKFGKLFSHYGEWDGKHLIDSSYVAKALKPGFSESPWYGYGFWLSDYKGKEISYMRGVFGQYVIMIPEDKVIIVRLGQKFIRQQKNHHHEDFYMYIDEAYKMMENASPTQS